MPFFWKLIYSTLLLTFACAANAQTYDTTQPPKEFKTYVISFLGPKNLVQLEEQGRLAYYAAPPDVEDVLSVQPIYITPTPKQWQAFYAALSEHNIWDWQESYMPEQAVPDSPSWSIKLTHGDKTLNSSGYGATPENYGHFLKAVSDLIGHDFY